MKTAVEWLVQELWNEGYFPYGVPDELIGNLGDVHLYKNHVEQAKEQLTREPYSLPTLKIENEVKWAEGDCLPTYSPTHFTLEKYQSHPTIKAPLSN